MYHWGIVNEILGQPPLPDASVVIASRDRPTELLRCIRALRDQETPVTFEVVVVDDGSVHPIRAAGLACDGQPPVVVIRREGVGPGLARNAGVERAQAAVILFTDDDTLPAPTWVDAACCFLADHPDHIGVEGPTVSEPFDPLYYHSVRAASPGSLLTCNVGYRRAAFAAVGGFAHDFPSAHAEDRDLGIRITELGPLGFVPDMAVEHPPKPITLAWAIRRGRDLVSDSHLYRRHSHLYPLARYFSAPGYAFALNLKHWTYSAIRDRYHVGRDPKRALRFLAFAAGYTVLGAGALAHDCLRRTTRASA